MSLPHLKHSHKWLMAGMLGLSAMACLPAVSAVSPARLLVNAAQAEDELGPDVGKQLQQAQAALASHHAARALE